MDVSSVEEAIIAENAGACAVMALDMIPSKIRKQGGIARLVGDSRIFFEYTYWPPTAIPVLVRGSVISLLSTNLRFSRSQLRVATPHQVTKGVRDPPQ